MFPTLVAETILKRSQEFSISFVMFSSTTLLFRAPSLTSIVHSTWMEEFNKKGHESLVMFPSETSGVFLALDPVIRNQDKRELYKV